MITAILILTILNLLLTIACIMRVMESAVVTWQKQDKQTEEFDKSLAELMTIVFNADKIREKAAEHPGENVDLEKLL